jgi:hypothetical protein
MERDLAIFSTLTPSEAGSPFHIPRKYSSIKYYLSARPRLEETKKVCLDPTHAGEAQTRSIVTLTLLLLSLSLTSDEGLG